MTLDGGGDVRDGAGAGAAAHSDQTPRTEAGMQWVGTKYRYGRTKDRHALGRRTAETLAMNHNTRPAVQTRRILHPLLQGRTQCRHVQGRTKRAVADPKTLAPEEDARAAQADANPVAVRARMAPAAAGAAALWPADQTRRSAATWCGFHAERHSQGSEKNLFRRSARGTTIRHRWPFSFFCLANAPIWCAFTFGTHRGGTRCQADPTADATS